MIFANPLRVAPITQRRCKCFTLQKGENSVQQKALAIIEPVRWGNWTHLVGDLLGRFPCNHRQGSALPGAGTP